MRLHFIYFQIWNNFFKNLLSYSKTRRICWIFLSQFVMISNILLNRVVATTHLPPITKTIKVRRTRHAGHCWSSRDELINDVFLWTPSHGRAKAGWPARSYIPQLCEDTGCSSEDLPEEMNDRQECRERVRDIRAGGTTGW